MEHLLKLPQVEASVCLKKSKIYALIAQGAFPAPIKVGHSSSWLSSEIQEWIASHAALRTTPKAAEVPA